MYIYIYIHTSIGAFGAQLSQFELFELVLLSKLDKQLPVEQFEATSISVECTVPPLKIL